MQYKAFMIKYAEIGTKGKNRYIFEDILCKNINRKLKPYGDFYIRKEQGRIFVECKSDYDYEDVVNALGKVFGIVGICPVVVEENTEFENLKQKVIDYVEKAYDRKNFTFKVFTRRNDKTYPMTSMEVSAELGHFLLEAFPDLAVDVHSPQEIINVEIRKVAYIYSITIPGPGGLPVGTNGRGMALLSGGIDSPVAAYMEASVIHVYAYSHNNIAYVSQERSCCGGSIFPRTSVHKRESKAEGYRSGMSCGRLLRSHQTPCCQLCRCTDGNIRQLSS